jgi:hypothetical protein
LATILAPNHEPKNAQERADCNDRRNKDDHSKDSHLAEEYGRSNLNASVKFQTGRVAFKFTLNVRD